MLAYDVPVTQDWQWHCEITVQAPADPLYDNVLYNITKRSAFTLVRTDGPADITVYPTTRSGYAGYFTVNYDGDGWATDAHVEVGTKARGVVMHELLHVLGLQHAERGIMHPVYHRDTLTKVDRAALRGLTCGA